MRYITTFIAGLVLVSLSIPVSAQRDRVSTKPVFVSYQGTQGQPLRNPNGIFYYAKRQEIYVADSGSHQIVIFDKKGSAIDKFTHFVDKQDGRDRMEGEPRGVAVNSKGDIFVTDNLAKYIDILDYRGRSIKRIYPGDYLEMPRESVTPVQLCIDPEDNLYVAVSGDESCILVLDKNLKLKKKIGKKGKEPGQFQSTSGVWVDKQGKVYVTDALGNEAPVGDKLVGTSVQVFDKEGNYQFGFGDKGFGPMSFGLPTGCITDKQGNIWVLDGVQNKVAVFDDKGGWITNGCGNGRAAGDVLYPTYISGDGLDTLYISERIGRRIQCVKIIFKED